jgi:excinuclease UvrABC nuclease subunit
MYNRNKEIIYIGKTKNLRERLSSYFSHNPHLPSKIRKLLRSVSSIKWEVKFSELSALIYESKLIKKYKPRFNSAIKRYRLYPFIKIDIGNPYPRIYKVYEIMPDGALYFGPFSGNATVEHLINIINKNFRIRKCRDRHLKPSKNRTPCMYFEIGQCKAPCNFNTSIKEYRNEINKVCEFLISDGSSGAVALLTAEMKREAENLNFEKAALLRNFTEDLKKVILNTKATHSVIQMKNMLIKCRNNDINSFELFHIQGGRIVNTYYIDDKITGNCKFINDLTEKIILTFFNGSLFENYPRGQSEKFTREDTDALKIITNWLYRNFSPVDVFKITPQSDISDMRKFILN